LLMAAVKGFGLGDDDDDDDALPFCPKAIVEAFFAKMQHVKEAFCQFLAINNPNNECSNHAAFRSMIPHVWMGVGKLASSGKTPDVSDFTTIIGEQIFAGVLPNWVQLAHAAALAKRSNIEVPQVRGAPSFGELQFLINCLLIRPKYLLTLLQDMQPIPRHAATAAKLLRTPCAILETHALDCFMMEQDLPSPDHCDAIQRWWHSVLASAIKEIKYEPNVYQCCLPCWQH
jgi:hypothetical protein